MPKRKKPLVTWILEQNTFDEGCWAELVNILKRKEIPYRVVNVVPFEHTIEGDVSEIESKHVVCYGSIGMMKAIKNHKFDPGSWESDLLSPEIYSERLGDLYINHDAKIMKLKEVEEYINTNNIDRFFCKPNDDFKEFSGKVFEKEEFARWLDNLLKIGYITETNFNVIVSPVKNIGREYRLISVDNKIVAWSMYRENGERKEICELDGGALYAATKAQALFKPLDVYVIDIAETDEGWKVMEYGTLNCAGWYKCDVNNIVTAINDLLKKRKKEND